MSSYWLSFATFTHPRVPSIRLGLLILFCLFELVWFKFKHLKCQLGPTLVKSSIFRSKVVSWGPAFRTFFGPTKEGHLAPLVSDANYFYHRGQMRLPGNGKCFPSWKIQMQKYRSAKQNCFDNVSLTHLNQFSFPIGVRNCTQIHLGVL